MTKENAEELYRILFILLNTRRFKFNKEWRNYITDEKLDDVKQTLSRVISEEYKGEISLCKRTNQNQK